jgi:tRNA-2-methylthio-N6-dimethylallyladenosine synthase
MIYNVNNGDFQEYIDRVRLLNSDSQKRVYIFTFGCQQNEADSEKILGIANAMGYSKTDTPDDADLIILNTCAIRQHAEEKALSMLGRFKALKRKNNSLIVGVCGCMAAEEHIKELLKTDFHYVTFTLEPNMLCKIPYLVYRALEDGKRSFIIGEDCGDVYEGMPITRRCGHKAWVSIMYGCNNFCSYCIVPYVRGRERSRSVEDILSECRSLVEDGVKEITLLGQNVNSYKGECDFATLLEKIAMIDGDFIIRFMTSHPKDVSDSLIDVMAKYTPKIAPYFHLPLQSGSDRILKSMNRTYNRERFLFIVDKLRAGIPNICLSTDVIVGFPSETEEDFLDTLEVLKKARFDMVYAFKYSPREGTPAARMKDQVDTEIKEDRIARLLKMQDDISSKNNEKHVGTTMTVLVDSLSRRKDKNTVNARSYGNKLVHFEGDESMIGKYMNVKIERAGVYELYAEKI